ncbi:MAG: D-alanyl-D-alanine carboxypeptidase [Oscillospiraceae bacterium]|nr:D-alanyl-D-alanine carboxypeptidase [Oscillospiraceae bacterium]
MKKHRFLPLFLAVILFLNPLSVLASDGLTEADSSIEAYDTGSSLTEDSFPSEEPVDPEEENAEETESIPADSFVPSDPIGLSLGASGSLFSDEDFPQDAAAVLMMERTTGTMVFAKNIDGHREPASVTKVMTCLLALEYGGLYDVIPVTESALEGMDPDGSSAELSPGEEYTLEELLYCLMVASANDAALVLAEYLGGSQDGFVEMMNRKAEDLGCTGTHFANPHGMHDDDHYTTARDLALIFSAAMEYELFRTLISTTYYELTVPVSPAEAEYDEETEEAESEQAPEVRELHTTDYLISTSITDEYYDERVLGGKTGFTTPAGRCVISLAQDGDLSYLIVVLGAQAWNEDDTPYYGNFVTVSALLDAAAALSVVPLADETTSVSIKVPKGRGMADLICRDPVSALLPAGFGPDDLTSVSILSDGLEAPLDEGVPVGTLEFRYRGVYLGSSPLLTAAPVDLAIFRPERQRINHAAFGREYPVPVSGPLPLPA